MVDKIQTQMELNLEISEQLRQVQRMANEFQKMVTSSLGLYKNAENLKRPLADVATETQEAAAAVKDLLKSLQLAEKGSLKALANSSLLKQQRQQQKADDAFVGSESLRAQETVQQRLIKIGENYRKELEIQARLKKGIVDLDTLSYQKQLATARLGEQVAKLGTTNVAQRESINRKILQEEQNIQRIEVQMRNIVEQEKTRLRIQEQINQRIKEQVREQARLQKEAERRAQQEKKQAEREQRKALQKDPGESRLDRILEDGGASLLAIQARLLINYQLINSVLGTVRFGVTFVTELDQAFKELQAIVGLTDLQMTRLKVNILDVAKNSKFSATEVAQAAITLGQAGFSSDQIRNSLKAVNDLATASGSTLQTAVSNVTSVLNVFNYGADQTAQVANLMTSALNLSKLSMDQITLGIQYAANTAVEAKVPFSEMIATFGVLANVGIRSGSTIGTGYRKLLQDLLSPTDKFKTRVAELGISLDQLDIKTKGVSSVLKTLKEAGFTASDALATLDLRAAAVLVPLLQSGDAISKFQQKLYLTESIVSGSTKQMESLNNSLNRLKNAFGTILFDAFEGLVGTLASVARGFADVLANSGPVAELLKGIVVTLVGIASAAITVSLLRTISGITGITKSLMMLREGLVVGAAAFANFFIALRAGTGIVFSLQYALYGLYTALGPIGLALLAVGAIATIFFTSMGKQADALEQAQSKLADLEAETQKYQQRTEALNNFINTTIEQYKELSTNTDALRAKTLEAGLAFNKMSSDVIGVGDSVDTLISKLRQLSVENAQAAAAAKERQINQLQLTNTLLETDAASKRKSAQNPLSDLSISASFGKNEELKGLVADVKAVLSSTATPSQTDLDSLASRISQAIEKNTRDKTLPAGSERMLTKLDEMVTAQIDTVKKMEANNITLGELKGDLAGSKLDTRELDRVLKDVQASDSNIKFIKEGFGRNSSKEANELARRNIEAIIIDLEDQVNTLKGQEGADKSKSLANVQAKLAQATGLRLELDKQIYEREKARLESSNKDADLTTKELQIKAQIGSVREAQLATEQIIQQARIKEKNAIEEAVAFTRSEKFIKENFSDRGINPPTRKELDNDPVVLKYIEQARREAALTRQIAIDQAQKSLTTRRASSDPAQERPVITDFQQFRFELQQSTIAYKAQIDAIEAVTNRLQAQRQSMDTLRNSPFIGSGARFKKDLEIEDQKRSAAVEKRNKSIEELERIRKGREEAEKFFGVSVKDAERNAAQGIDYSGNAIGRRGTKAFKLDQQQAKAAQAELIKLAEAERQATKQLEEANAEFEQFGEIVTQNEPILKTFTEAFEEFTYANYYGAKAMSDDFKKLFGEIKDGFGAVVKGFVTGTKSIKDSFKDLGIQVLETLADIAIKKGTQSLFDSIFSVGSAAATSSSGGGGGFLSFLGLASGGKVEGGIRGRDSVPTMLMPDEYVVKASAARAIGYETLDRLNSGNTNVVSQSGRIGAMASNDNGGTEVNVWLVRPDAVPPMGPKDVIATVTDNIARGGELRTLIKSVQV